MFIKNQKGGAIVEFAIVLPLLVLIIGGVIELGLLFYNEQVIINASREGARAGIIAYMDGGANKYFSEDGDIETIIENYCEERLITFKDPPDNVVINSDEWPDRTASGFIFETPFTVIVEYDYTFLLPSIIALGAQTTLTGVTTMLNQHVIKD